MTLETDISCLGQLPLFRSLPGPRLKLVALMGERLKFAPGATIITRGEEPEGVLLILRGDVEMLRPDAEEEGGGFAFQSGSIIGDVPLLSGQTYLGDIRAISQVEALLLPKDLFLELLQTVPDFGMAIARDLAVRLYRLAGHVLENEKVH